MTAKKKSVTSKKTKTSSKKKAASKKKTSKKKIATKKASSKKKTASKKAKKVDATETSLTLEKPKKKATSKKKTTAKKASSKKKSTAKKSTSKKATTKKKAVAKKATSKKATAKKTVSKKKSTAKKAASKKKTTTKKAVRLPRAKAKKIHAILDDLYPETPIPLDHIDPYTLLVAVLLSAQCRDERVNRITPGLFAMANTPYEMVKRTPEDIEEIIRPCGLAPRKSKAIHTLSQIIIDKHDGKVPDNLEDLEALPGVGHKTASVVIAQAFGKPAFPVDTHIHRLAARWGLSSGKNVVQTERDLKELFPKKSWNKVHLQIIFFGREHCPARGHVIEDCPICSWGYVE